MYLYIQREPAITHNLIQIAEILNAPPNIEKAARELNPDYLTTRYPDAANGIPAEQYDMESASLHLKYAEEISQWVKSKLK